MSGNPLMNGNNRPNITALFQQFMQNPVQAFMGARLNIPKEIQGNPDAIIQHLMSTGQMTQQQYNQVQQMAKNIYR